jgi:mannose-6-phosphate isomerase-like protein (cupin superfamily)
MDAASLHVDDAPAVTAPDGSTVHVLVRTAGGSMARFTLPPGAVSRAVRHRTVAELWYFVAGSGRMWLCGEAATRWLDVAPGLSVAIPPGTAFQFRTLSDTPLQVVGVTMPPWPGADEAELVPGPWTATP